MLVVAPDRIAGKVERMNQSLVTSHAMYLPVCYSQKNQKMQPLLSLLNLRVRLVADPVVLNSMVGSDRVTEEAELAAVRIVIK